MAARTGLSGAAGLGIPEKRLAELLCGQFVDDDAGCIREGRPFAQRRNWQILGCSWSSKLIKRVVGVLCLQLESTAAAIDRNCTYCSCYPKPKISIGKAAFSEWFSLAVCIHVSPRCWSIVRFDLVRSLNP